MTKRAQLRSFSSRQLWLGGIGLALISLALLFREIFQFTVVVGESMLPTLRTGDLLLVYKRAYVNTEPHRGDIVVARNASELIVKRIVGLPGEEVEVKMGKLYINGSPTEEDHQIEEGWIDVGSGRLLEGEFATLGDNRAVPPLTAVHPILTKEDILGRVILAAGKKLR